MLRRENLHQAENCDFGERVFYSAGSDKEAFERINVVKDESLNALVVSRNLNDPEPLVFPFSIN